MKFGLRNTSFLYPNGTGRIWQDTKTHIQRAERDGFNSFWVTDHFFQLPTHGSQEEPFLDAWTVLPALAAVTSRIRLGAMVSPVGYRNPALLARMAARLDHISGGRMNFGFGAGGFKPEYKAYGVVGEYAHVGADHLCLDFAGNDPESYELFVEQVLGKF